MKKILLLFVLVLGLNCGATYAAAGDAGDKGIQVGTNAVLQDDTVVNSKLPRLMVLYINNAKTDYNAEIDAKIMDHLKKLAVNRWVLVSGDLCKDKLASMGIQSFTMAERADILAVAQDSDADAILLVEIEPFIVRDVITFFTIGKKITTSVPVKAIDKNTGLYVYNGKFVEMGQDNSMIGGIGNKSVIMKALDQFLTKFDDTIPAKLVTVKHVDKVPAVAN